MDSDVIVLKDPLNNQVRLPKKFEDELSLDQCVDKDLSRTIVKPAMIILPREEGDSLYHARLVGWDTTVLLKSEWQKGYWLVSECSWDVDSKQLRELMSHGECVTF
jgi:hypothetical protein